MKNTSLVPRLNKNHSNARSVQFSSPLLDASCILSLLGGSYLSHEGPRTLLPVLGHQDPQKVPSFSSLVNYFSFSVSASFFSLK